MRVTFRCLWLVCLLAIGGSNGGVLSQPQKNTNAVRCPPAPQVESKQTVPEAFTSGVTQPSFSSPFYFVTDPEGLAQRFGRGVLVRDDIRTAIEETGFIQESQGTYYYLGFRHNFENYYFETNNQSYPRTVRFRIGLRHNGNYDPDQAGFSHFRIRVLDSSGDDVLGFNAATGEDELYASDMMFALGWTDPYYFQRGLNSRDFMMGAVDAQIGAGRPFSTMRRSNRHAEGALSAVHERRETIWDEYFVARPDDSPGVDGFYIRRGAPFLIQNLRAVSATQYEAALVDQGLTYTNLMDTAWLTRKGDDPEPGRRLFALPPDQMYDFPPEIFTWDEILTLEAWAENDLNQAISPVSSLTLSTRVRFEAEAGVLANNRFDYPNARTSFGLIGYNFYYTWEDSSADPVQQLIAQYGPHISANLDLGGMVLDMVILDEK